MNNFHDQGRSLYRRGEYREAIKCFDRAIGRGASVQLHDNRAACYEKLNELSSALQDAKKAIQLHREDPTGYLRAGRVLTKMDKHSTALEIYSHGLKSVKHVGNGYELLKDAHKHCLDIVSPPRSVDPLTVLPRELAQHVLEYLSFRQRINACRVSRGWCQYIRSLPDLWTHLDLTGARRRVRTAFISTAINKGRSKLRKATLNNLYDLNRTLKAVLRTCSVEELSLLECGVIGGQDFVDAMRCATKLKSLTIKRSINIVSLETVLQMLSGHIESITLNSVPALLRPPSSEKVTYFSASMRSLYCTMELLRDVPTLYPNIQSLVLTNPDKTQSTGRRSFDLAPCQNLRHLDLAFPMSTQNTLTLPPNLETLHLDPMAYDDSDDILYSILTRASRPLRLQALQELVLTLKDSATCSSACALLEGFETGALLQPTERRGWSRLRCLSLRGGSVGEIDLSKIFGIDRLQDLEELRMPLVHDCDDNKLNEVVSALPKLRVLDVSGTDITGVGVKNAIRKTCIKDINLTNCRKVGVDAVEWARSEGVKVKYKIAS